MCAAARQSRRSCTPRTHSATGRVREPVIVFVVVLVVVVVMGSGSNDAGVDDDDDDEEERDDSSDGTAATDADAATSENAVMRRCSRGLAFGIPLAATALLLIRAPPIAH